MSQILAENLIHYTVVHSLNFRNLNNSAAEHLSAYWRSMKDCLRDIHAFDVGYKRAKGYCRTDFNAPEPSTINEVKSLQDPGSCFR